MKIISEYQRSDPSIQSHASLAFLLLVPLLACGETVTHTYDDLNRLIRTDYGGGKAVEYTYDAAGNRLRQTVSVPNQLPLANAGASQTVNIGVLVTLDGSASSDPDKAPAPLTYFWTQTEGPKVTLNAPKTSKPRFSPVVAGRYVFKLVVSDGKATSTPAYVTIIVEQVQLQVLYPNGAEVLKVGNRVTLKWNSSKDQVKPNIAKRVSIFFSKNGGARWFEIADRVENLGRYDWRPTRNEVTNQARIQVCLDAVDNASDKGGAGKSPRGLSCDQSDSDFKIVK